MICGAFICGFGEEASAAIYAAFIGLLGGILALIGAIIVGFRQVAIQREQTHIQRRQVDLTTQAIGLEATKIRADLFDRRYEIYDATRRFIAFIISHNAVPGWNLDIEGVDPKDSQEIELGFRQAIDRSRLLFKPDVTQRLHGIWETANDLHQNQVSPSPEGEPEEDRRRRELSEVMRRRMGLFETLTNLHELFGEELQIGAETEPSEGCL